MIYAILLQYIIAQCIQSVLTQSYENLDIILVDDGSSDESLEIALKFAKKDKRIFVISKPNGGLSSARNTGIEFIKGSALREFFDSCYTTSNCHTEGVARSISTRICKQFRIHKQRYFAIAQYDKNNSCLSTTPSYTTIPCHTAPSCHTEGVARSISNGNDRDSSLRTSVSLRMTNDLDISVFSKPQYDNKNLVSNDNVPCHTERSEVSHIQSLSQTHSFAKTYKSLSTKEVQSHFKKLQPNFIKSDLERINDFITQELPQDALIHFIDSDDYIEPRCIEICVQNLCEKDLDIFVHNWSDFDEETKTLSKGAYMGKLKKIAMRVA